jgi:hypothetical protein
MVLCKFCGKEIHFDPSIRSSSGKFIPLSGAKGTAKHRCKIGLSIARHARNGGGNNVVINGNVSRNSFPVLGRPDPWQNPLQNSV